MADDEARKQIDIQTIRTLQDSIQEHFHPHENRNLNPEQAALGAELYQVLSRLADEFQSTNELKGRLVAAKIEIRKNRNTIVQCAEALARATLAHFDDNASGPIELISQLLKRAPVHIHKLEVEQQQGQPDNGKSDDAAPPSPQPAAAAAPA
jgi:hypothetical protein